MKPVIVSLALTLCMSLGIATAADWWNPFARKDTDSRGPTRSALLEGNSLSASRSKKYRTSNTSGPTMTQKVVGGTVDVLTLKPLRQKIKGSHWSPGPSPKVVNMQQLKAKQSKPRLFSSLFKPKEPEQPRTVEEWLVQKRPPY